MRRMAPQYSPGSLPTAQRCVRHTHTQNVRCARAQQWVKMGRKEAGTRDSYLCLPPAHILLENGGKVGGQDTGAAMRRWI